MEQSSVCFCSLYDLGVHGRSRRVVRGAKAVEPIKEVRALEPGWADDTPPRGEANKQTANQTMCVV